MPNQNVPEYHAVYRTLHRPLTVGGVDRRLFFLALLVGAASFNLFFSFAAGCSTFAVLYGVALWCTAGDPQMLHILLRSATFRVRYDAARHGFVTLTIARA